VERFETAAEGDRRVGAPDPDDRGVEVSEGPFGDDCRDLGAEAAGLERLVDHQRPAGPLHRGEDHLGVPRPQRAQVDDLDVAGAVVGQDPGGLQRPADADTVGDDGGIAARAGDPGRAEGNRPPTGRDPAPLGPVERFVLQVQHRVRVVEGRQQQPFGVSRGGGGDDLEAGDVAEVSLDVLRVERAGARPAADRRPDHDGHRSSPAVVGGGEVVDDLIEAAADEVAELHLDHGVEAVERQAEGAAQRPRFDDRRIADPLLAELGHEPVGDLEGAAVLGDVLAEEHDALVGPHGFPQTLGDRVDVAQFARRRRVDPVFFSNRRPL
jgi:hypothetical protein